METKENTEVVEKDYSEEELNVMKADLEKKVEDLSKELQDMTFEIDIENRAFLNKLIKNIEKNHKWKHNEIMGYVMLCNNLKEEKNRKDLESSINLRTANVATFYRMLVEYTGTGIHEAKELLKTLTIVGESTSKAMKDIETFNNKIRETHLKLEDVETKLVANKEGLKVSK